MDEIYHEPTVLEYARFCGIAKDYLSINPLDEAVRNAAELDLDESLEDGPGLLQFSPPPELACAEKLSVDRETVVFLKEIMTTADTSFDITEPLSRADMARSLRVELPILRTDHEYDMLHFGHRYTPQLDDIALVPEPVDEEKDEGLSWPKAYLQLPEQIWEKATTEKLEISKEAIMFLQETLKIATEPESEEEKLLRDINYERVCVPTSSHNLC